MTDPLLAEIEHMIELHKKDGDDDTAFALKWVHKRILEDRERMINKYESYITQYGYDIGSSGHDVDDYLDDIRKIIKGQEEEKKDG